MCTQVSDILSSPGRSNQRAAFMMWKTKLPLDSEESAADGNSALESSSIAHGMEEADPMLIKNLPLAFRLSLLEVVG